MRLIDAYALEKEIIKALHEPLMDVDEAIDVVVTTIDDATTVDPVKHGEWRYDEALELEWCSECGFGKRKGDKRWYSYCPNCGAKMDEVER